MLMVECNKTINGKLEQIENEFPMKKAQKCHFVNAGAPL